jgi:hypothetical protein
LSDRLPSRIEAHGFLRQAEAHGGFAHVLKKGDGDRGAVALLIAQRGEPYAMLERRMGPDFNYEWARFDHPVQDVRTFIGDRTRIDPDIWLIELDIPDAERFIAETIVSG